VIFYGLADARLNEVVELFLTRAQAEEELAQVLCHEPDWSDSLSLVRLDLASCEPIVTPL
jgi:hypothetical protein